MQAAREQGARFVHVSTDEVYGSLGDEGLFTEKALPLDPNSPYCGDQGGVGPAGAEAAVQHPQFPCGADTLLQ